MRNGWTFCSSLEVPLQALNALCNGLMTEVVAAARRFDENDEIGSIVITGSKKAFAGALRISRLVYSTPL